MTEHARRVLIVVENLPVPFDRRVWLEATTLARNGDRVSVICPKAKGFNNPFRVEYHVVNLDTLESFEAGSEVDPDSLRARGLVAKQGLVKVLGRGELTKKLTVRAHAFSGSARAAIESAGGQAEIVPPPWGDRRPPAKGNALTNR